MSKKDNNQQLSIKAEVFNEVLSLIDDLNTFTKDKEYTYVVRYNIHNNQFYIAKKVGGTEVIYQPTYSKTTDELIKYLSLMIFTLKDFTSLMQGEFEEADREDDENYMEYDPDLYEVDKNE